MKSSNAEVGTKAGRELMEKLASGKAEIVCGVVVERGEPTNGLNLRLRLDAIHAEALRIKAAKAGR